MRYVADQTENGDPIVLDTERDTITGVAWLMCGCRLDEDAEKIAAALNAALSEKERGA